MASPFSLLMTATCCDLSAPISVISTTSDFQPSAKLEHMERGAADEDPGKLEASGETWGLNRLFFAASASASGDTGRFGTDPPKLYASSSSSSRQTPAFSIISTTHSGVATAWGIVYILHDPPPCRSILAEQQKQFPTPLQLTATPSQADQHDFQRQAFRNVFHRQD